MNDHTQDPNAASISTSTPLGRGESEMLARVLIWFATESLKMPSDGSGDDFWTRLRETLTRTSPGSEDERVAMALRPGIEVEADTPIVQIKAPALGSPMGEAGSTTGTHAASEPTSEPEAAERKPAYPPVRPANVDTPGTERSDAATEAGGVEAAMREANLPFRLEARLELIGVESDGFREAGLMQIYREFDRSGQRRGELMQPAEAAPAPGQPLAVTVWRDARWRLDS